MIFSLMSIFKGQPSFIIDSSDSLEEAVLRFGVLPFFKNPVKGLSVDELCEPGMLFGGNEYEGCWEWKGPVIRRKTTVYGKFFRRKAGFISLELLPDFLNYRHAAYPIKPDSTEQMLLDIISKNEGLTSTELKSYIFGDIYKRKEWDDLPDHTMKIPMRGKRKSLESPLQRLQMSGRLIISDFEYKHTKRGERYGWGVARYSTPELFFGSEIHIPEDKTPEESLKTLKALIKKRWPSASSKALGLLLK